MSRLSGLVARLRALFHRAALERELDAEIRFHVERETERNLRAGMAPDEALRRARLAFGGVEAVVGQAVEPLVYGRSMGLSAVAVVVARRATAGETPATINAS